MRDEIQRQREFWDSERKDFDAIYTHEKSRFMVLLDRIFRKDMYQRFDFTIRNAEPIQGRTYLDVGCGTGLYSVEFAKRGAEHVLGLDISDNMIQASWQYAKKHNVEEKCNFVTSDLLEYTDDSKFDVTIGIGLFDYIREPLPVIKKMNELTEDKIILSFPRLLTWRAPIRKVRLSMKHCDVFFYTRKKILSLLKDAGVKENRIEKVGKLYCVVALCN